MKKEVKQKQGVFKPTDRRVWPHEDRAAEILAAAGHYIEFLPENMLHSADILLDGVRYELKSPRSPKPNSMEQLIKDALYKNNAQISFLIRCGLRAYAKIRFVNF